MLPVPTMFRRFPRGKRLRYFEMRYLLEIEKT